MIWSARFKASFVLLRSGTLAKCSSSESSNCLEMYSDRYCCSALIKDEVTTPKIIFQEGAVTIGHMIANSIFRVVYNLLRASVIPDSTIYFRDSAHTVCGIEMVPNKSDDVSYESTKTMIYAVGNLHDLILTTIIIKYGQCSKNH